MSLEQCPCSGCVLVGCGLVDVDVASWRSGLVEMCPCGGVSLRVWPRGDLVL